MPHKKRLFCRAAARRLIVIGSTAALILMGPGPARAAESNIVFSSVVPMPTRFPAPPLISGVSIRPVHEGDASLHVTARIDAQTALRRQCDPGPCAAHDWTMAPNPDVSPNPPPITTARAWYYFNGNAGDAAFAAMALNAQSGLWEADIPLPGGLVAGDTATVYLVAADALGNTAAQSPGTGAAPCSGAFDWNAENATPAINGCESATYADACGDAITRGAPRQCPEDAVTTADPLKDVCTIGMKGDPGERVPWTSDMAGMWDITGLSAGADASDFCARINIRGFVGMYDDPHPGFALFILNSGKISLSGSGKPSGGMDTNPLRGARAITFSPGMVSFDPTLAKALWDLDCVTNASGSNDDCRLQYAVGDNPDFAVGNQSWNIIPVSASINATSVFGGQPYTLLDADPVTLLALSYSTVGIGDRMLKTWNNDYAPGMTFYRNGSTTVAVQAPAPRGGRKEIGNLNCDDSVNIADFILLQSAYGTAAGDPGYKAWADINSDGSVDIGDFLIIKQNYGKTLDAAPSYDPEACK